MAKSKNLNTHKGRAYQKLIKRKSLPRKFSTKGNGIAKTELIFVCIDTCTFIDLYEKRSKKRKDEEYYSCLDSVKQMSMLKYDGTINPRGKLVLCMTPSTISEISVNGKIMYKYHSFYESRIMPLNVDPEFETQFHKYVKLLVKKYNDCGLFLDKDNNPTMDGINTAQASLLNSTFMSRDHHVVSTKGTKLFENKSEIIQQINEEFFKKYSLITQEESLPARPIPKTTTAENFLRKLAKGSLQPNPLESKFLSKETINGVNFLNTVSKCKKVPETLENPLKNEEKKSFNSKKRTIKITRKEPTLVY